MSRNWIKLGFGFGLVLLIAGIALTAVKKTALPTPSGQGEAFQLAVGATLPNFEFQSIDGEVQTFKRWGTEQKAKVVIINFWATWCGACVEEMPSLLKLVKRFNRGEVQLLPINVDEEPANTAPKLVEDEKWGFSKIFIDQGQKLGDLFNIQGIPLTIIARSDGRVLKVESGGDDWDTPKMRAELQGWIR